MHEIIKCTCGKVIAQCRCMRPDKKTTIRKNGCDTCKVSTNQVLKSDELVDSTVNKQVKFKVEYKIIFEGVSRADDSGVTFQERIIDAAIDAIIHSLSRYKTLKIQFDKKVTK